MKQCLLGGRHADFPRNPRLPFKSYGGLFRPCTPRTQSVDTSAAVCISSDVILACFPDPQWISDRFSYILMLALVRPKWPTHYGIITPVPQASLVAIYFEYISIFHIDFCDITPGALVRTDVSEERLTFLIRQFLWPWWWRRYVHPKRRLLQELHGVA
jgi:hypothetical protein